MPPELLGINCHVNLKVIFFFLPPDIRRQNVDSVYKHYHFVSKFYRKKATKHRTSLFTV